MSDPSQPAGRELRPGGPLDLRTARGLLAEADALAARGEYEQAVNYYGRLIGHTDPQIHVAALLGVAECRYRLDEDDVALQAWTMATQAPDTPLAWLAWKRLAEARVRAGDLRGAMDGYRQADRRAPPAEKAAIAARLGWLNKESGNERAARRHFGRARADGLAAPLLTYAILALTVGIGVSAILDPTVGDLWLSLFGLDKQAVARGELYRLLTVVLVHDNRLILHLAFNMYALYLVGPIIEEVYGRVRFLAFYLLAAAGGSVASYVFTPQDSVGASGAIFGLFGVLFVARRVHHAVLSRQARALSGQIGMLIVFNLILGFAFGGRIDNAAHVGGLLAGIWLGATVPPRATLAGLWRWPSSPALGFPAEAARPPLGVAVVARGLAVGLLIAVIAAGVALGTQIRT